ncbi:MAG: hypothetical protein WBV80_21665 [Mycobacterium sp.]
MNRRMKLLGDAAGAAAVIGLGLGGAGTATASAASHPAVKVIQNCGKYRACASYRPATFSLGFGKVKQIHWYRYNSRKAVGWGHFGKHYICNAKFAEGDTCVKLTFTDSVTKYRVRYYQHLLFQPATMGSTWRWSWHTARWVGSR